MFSLLKRLDEKAVTERAYENPVFVEDLVREVGTRLRNIDDYCRRGTFKSAHKPGHGANGTWRLLKSELMAWFRKRKKLETL